jgi:D-inositol-3-phosphate glycosyltransferase
MLISEHADPLARPGSKEVGGQNVYVFNLARELAAIGWKVDVYTRWDSSSKKRTEVVQKGVRVIRVKAGPRKYIVRDTLFGHLDDFTADIISFTTKNRLEYDAIHTHYWMSGVVGLALKKLWKVPLIHTPHSLGYVRYNTLKNLGKHVVNDEFFKTRIHWETTLGTDADLTLTTSPVEQREIQEYYGTPAAKIAVATIGVNPKDFYPVPIDVARRHIGQPLERKIVLYAGRLEWRKGIDTLLEAFAALRHASAGQADSLRLLIVGRATGPDKADADRLKARAKQLGIRPYVDFVGSRDREQLKYYYSAANVCAVPSYYESFGIVPLEALACATPVAASKVGGLQYTIRPGKSGALFKAQDSSALASALQDILNDKSGIREKVRDFAKNELRTEFSWNTITQSIADHYNQLIARNKETI